MTEQQERRVPLTGAYNFRDIGGYPALNGRRTRWGRVYRSSTLHRLTDEDVLYLENLGVRTVYDLRSLTEAERDPSRLLDRAGIHVFHNPIYNPVAPLDSDSVALPGMSFRMAERYCQTLDHNQANFRKILELLADENTFPFVVHCVGGKDRTGVTIALILRVLGVPDEIILDDYVLTNTYFAPRREQSYARMLEKGHTPEVIHQLIDVDPEWMEEALAHLDRDWGTVERYLLEAGVTRDTLASVQRNLTE